MMSVALCVPVFMYTSVRLSSLRLTTSTWDEMHNKANKQTFIIIRAIIFSFILSLSLIPTFIYTHSFISRQILLLASTLCLFFIFINHPYAWPGWQEKVRAAAAVVVPPCSGQLCNHTLCYNNHFFNLVCIMHLHVQTFQNYHTCALTTRLSLMLYFLYSHNSGPNGNFEPNGRFASS